jgi:hypothetical protein
VPEVFLVPEQQEPQIPEVVPVEGNGRLMVYLAALASSSFATPTLTPSPLVLV